MKLSLASTVLFATILTSHAQTIRPYAPELFPEDLSGAVCGFSADGNIIYFVREQRGTNQLWLYEAKKFGHYWANEQVLPFSGVYSDMGGRFNHDRTIFYFTSDRPGGSDNKDDVWNIWQVHKTTYGWAEPIPLKNINNKGMECCPVPLANGHLLFSGSRGKEEWQLLISDGKDETHVGDVSDAKAWQWPSYELTGQYLVFNSMKRSDSEGMDDIYVSRWVDGKWGAAINPGPPINTKAYEDGAIFTPDGKTMIFCRHETANSPSKVLCFEGPIVK